MNAPLDNLPPLRDIIRRHGLSARKSLGQNFLLDLNLAARIARAAKPLEGATIIEVGPGPGGLTRALLALGASRVIAVERDIRAVAALQETASHFTGKLIVVPEDAMQFDVTPYLGRGPVRIVSNLPFNISTALLMKWLTVEPWPPWYDRLVLTFQREVAQRIVARPRTKLYGRLAILTQWRTEPDVLFDITPRAFVPAPKVTASVVRITPRPAPLTCDCTVLERVTEVAFGQRRKMLRQSLKPLGLDPAALLRAADIDPTARAEEVPIQGFVSLARIAGRLPPNGYPTTRQPGTC
jgi:16S rRNA (adenine1518-N6/adenine1519-N6)-dimethyltransferase